MSSVTVDFWQDGIKDNLILVVQSHSGLGNLRQVFQDLADSKFNETDLCAFPWVNCRDAISRLKLRLITDKTEPATILKASKDGLHRFGLEWSRHSDGWLENAELLDGLTGPGHQFLDYGSNRATIEVSYLEN
jgi:hypothetical protein